MFKFGSKRDITMEFKCAIRLLDDNEVLQADFKREDKGQFLMDFTIKSLNLMETDYFGLRYVDAQKQRNWLDPTRSIIKQVKGLDPIVFCFRVKFYPADPSRIKEEVTRYLVYLQLRRDLLHGRLYCSSSDATTLMAYVVQSELGDHDPEEHNGNYISELKLVMNQTPKLEDLVMQVHQKDMRGQTPAEAELNFLKKACQLETYGIDPHPVKDHKGNQLYLGINHSGILTFQGSRKTNNFKWSEIQKITYEGRMFIIHCKLNEKKHLIGFKCPSISSCHYLWRCAVEQRYFFTMNSSRDIPFVTTGGGIFSRSCKLRYTGRVEKEILEEMRRADRTGANIQRSYSTTSAPMRTIGRSNTAPLPHSLNNHESPGMNRDYYNERVPYLNYCTFSEPYDDGHNTNMTIASLPPSLDPFDEEDWDVSMTSSLPTEFDLRPDLTPTNEESPQMLNFEKPQVRASPSHTADIDTDIMGDAEEDNQANHVANHTQSNSNSLKSNSNKNNNNLRSNKLNNKRNVCSQLLFLIRTSILCSLLLLLLFSCLLVLIIESDSRLFSHIRKLPEMVVLTRDYYEPIKETVFGAFNAASGFKLGRKCKTNSNINSNIEL